MFNLKTQSSLSAFPNKTALKRWKHAINIKASYGYLIHNVVNSFIYISKWLTGLKAAH